MLLRRNIFCNVLGFASNISLHGRTCKYSNGLVSSSTCLFSSVKSRLYRPASPPRTAPYPPSPLRHLSHLPLPSLTASHPATPSPPPWPPIPPRWNMEYVEGPVGSAPRSIFERSRGQREAQGRKERNLTVCWQRRRPTCKDV